MAGRKKGAITVKYTPELLELVLDLASRGVADYEIAAKLGIHRHTFAQHKMNMPAVAEAVAEGKKLKIERAVGKAFHIMFDDNHPKQWAALQLFLKTKCGWEAPKQINVTGVQHPSSITFDLGEEEADD